MIEGVIELPFDVPLLPVKSLKAGEISCLYERGNLRQLRFYGDEIVQMIYPAVRGINWETALTEITDEKITCDDKSFEINYSAIFRLGQIEYKSRIKITGKEDNSILIGMQGEALNNFESRRIGLCVLHPVSSCKGKKVTITRPDKTTYAAVFPEYVSPHQPFIDVQQMHWINNQHDTIQLIFEGDVFETEDQRNWSDNSYKTYSTPLDRPSPVLVEKGTTLEQRVTLTIRNDENALNKIAGIINDEISNDEINPDDISIYEISNDDISDEPVSSEQISEDEISNDDISDEPVSDEPISDETVSNEQISEDEISNDDISNEPVSDEQISDEQISDEQISEDEISHNEISNNLEEEKVPFPKIGYSRIPGSTLLTSHEIAALKKVPFDHYRIELFMSLPHWQDELQAAIPEAEMLKTSLELIVFFSHSFEKEISQLVQQLNKYEGRINSLLPLHIDHDVTPVFLIQSLYPRFKDSLPSIKIGYGTNAYFASLNRNRPVSVNYDFVSFSLNPQVHATDTRTIIENLESQQQILDSIRQFTTKPVYVSPITFQHRNKTLPDTRLQTYFGAAWTLTTIKNLCKAASITFYQTTGEKGITVNPESQNKNILKIYGVLARLKDFQPLYVIIGGKTDTITFENRSGEKLIYLIESPF